MTTKYKLNLLFDDHYRESSNGISNSDDIGSIESYCQKLCMG